MSAFVNNKIVSSVSDKNLRHAIPNFVNDIIVPDDLSNNTFNLANSLNALLTTQLTDMTDLNSLNIPEISPIYNINGINNDASTTPSIPTPIVTLPEPVSISTTYSTITPISQVPTSKMTVTRTTNKLSFPHIKLEDFDLSSNHMKYLKYFFNNYSKVIMPFCPNNEINPARDIILYYSKIELYVLSAVLACGALISFQISNTVVDEERYCGYLSNCMLLLSKSLNNNSKNEGLILTTLLLTSYNAASNVVKWRPHLETAGKLLINSMKEEEAGNEEEDLIKGQTLSFCRSWFFSIEIIANMTSSRGGTMNDEEWNIIEKSLDKDSKNMEDLKILISIGNNNFNLLFGYTNELAILLGNLCCTLRHIRLGENIMLSEISWILSKFEDEKIKNFQILSKSGYLRKNEMMNLNLGTSIPNNAVELFDDIDASADIYISWWDICYQANRLSAIIQILTRLFLLDKNHFLMISTIEETMKLLKFLKTKRKIKSYALMLIQFCVFLVGKWTTFENHKMLVTKYFNDLHDFGNIAAKYSIEKLEKIWRNEESHEEEDIINY